MMRSIKARKWLIPQLSVAAWVTGFAALYLGGAKFYESGFGRLPDLTSDQTHDQMPRRYRWMRTPMYDPAHISRYYDDYGEREWTRLVTTPADHVSFHIHRWYLRHYVQPGDHVLEVGAGPGRFTIELARRGARVTVGDISPGQLELNRAKVAEAGVDDAVAERLLLDIVDLSRFPDEHFDAVICYGGPVSYVFDRAGDAISEMLRVTKRSGYVLLSVMSLLGAARRFMPGVLEIVDQFGVDVANRINASGDLIDVPGNQHTCRMYRWSDLSALLAEHPCRIVAASAANFLSPQHEELIASRMNDPAFWEAFLAWELDFCREPGALDGGTHILAVVERRDDERAAGRDA